MHEAGLDPERRSPLAGGSVGRTRNESSIDEARSPIHRELCGHRTVPGAARKIHSSASDTNPG